MYVREINKRVVDEALTGMIKKYIDEIEELRVRLCESEQTCEVLRRQVSRLKTSSSNLSSLMLATIPNAPNGHVVDDGVDENGGILAAAKADIERLKARASERK